MVYYCCCSCCCCVVSISIEMCNYYLFNDWSLLLLSPWKNKNNFFIFNFKYKVLIFEYLWLRMFRHKGSQKSLEHGALYRNPLIRVQSFTFVPLAASIIKKISSVNPTPGVLTIQTLWIRRWQQTVNKLLCCSVRGELTHTHALTHTHWTHIYTHTVSAVQVSGLWPGSKRMNAKLVSEGSRWTPHSPAAAAQSHCCGSRSST